MTNPTKPFSSAELKSTVADCAALRSRITAELVTIQESRAAGTAAAPIPVNDRAARKFSKALADGEVLNTLEVPHSFDREQELFIMRDGVDMRLKALKAQLDEVLWQESERLAESMLPAWRELAREHTLLAVRLKSVEIRAREMLGQLVTGSGNFPLWDFVGVAEIIYPGQPIDGGVDNEAKAALAAKIVTASELREAKNVDRK